MQAFGRILGEVYRLQKRIDPDMCQASEADVYGLLNGIERNVEYHLFREQEPIDPAFVDAVYDGLESDNGYYGLAGVLESKGFKVDKSKIKRVLKWIQADGRYPEAIEKVQSSNSPAELKNLTLNEYER